MKILNLEEIALWKPLIRLVKIISGLKSHDDVNLQCKLSIYKILQR